MTSSKIWKSVASFMLALFASLTLSSLALAQTTTDYRLETIGGRDTYITNTSPYSYFGRAEYLIVGGTSTAQYWGMMKWDMTTLPTLASGDKVELMLYGLNFSGQSPTDMQLGMSATPWADTDGWKVFSWYGSVTKIVPATPYGNWMVVDITNWYNYWKSGQIVNNGILFLPSTSSNKYTAPASVDISVPWARPYLRVTKVMQVPQGLLLTWPLSTSYVTRFVTQKFGEEWWAGDGKCSVDQKIKLHSGTDYRAAAHTKIYAAYGGYVKTVFSVDKWASVIVIEHKKPDNNKFVTTYWHTKPYVAAGNWVNAGDLIAEVADISGAHFHFGLSNGGQYINIRGNVSAVGALPQTDCDGWPAFPSVFIDPEKNSQFRFQ